MRYELTMTAKMLCSSQPFKGDGDGRINTAELKYQPSTNGLRRISNRYVVAGLVSLVLPHGYH